MWGLVTGLISKVVGGYQERKAKEADAKQAWETAMGRSMEHSWKDEYVTIVITFPLWQIFIGNLVYAFSEHGDERLLLANQKSLEDIGALMGTPYGDVMMIVVLAAVGIKGLKALR